MTYPLEDIGPTGFQQLAAALCLKEFGPSVQVLGSGRDGGRDLYCDGVLLWKAHEGQVGEAWEGYTVIQVKHKERLGVRPQDNASWLWGEVRDELERWGNGGGGRGRVPKYLLIISNVPLTPTPESGGLAQVEQNIGTYIENLNDASRDSSRAAAAARRSRAKRLSTLQKWRIWDRTQVEALLNAHAGVRQGFSAFITPGDVLANLEVYAPLSIENAEKTLRGHARAALLRERSIYFDQAGAADTSGTPVDRVVTDLPVVLAADGERLTAIRHVLEHGDRVLKPKLGLYKGPRHIVLAGAPGNGKTTLSKFIVQTYRAALLAQAEGLGADHIEAIEGTRSGLRRMGLDLPRYRRWPMRIDLAEYAEESGANSTLLAWVSRKISERLDNVPPVKAWEMSSWRRHWPWLLVLDGLDEVSEPSVRQRLLENIAEFVGEAEAENCDMLVIVTTRPGGYLDELSSGQFQRADLAFLTPAEAVEYGTRATQVRLRNDDERVERVLKLLQAAAADEAMRNLLRTPLQVLIMTIIGENAGQFDPDRFSLFWTYYSTVLKREQSKTGGFAPLLREYAPQVLALHERLGLALQERSELAAGAMAALSENELRIIAWHVLDEAGYKPGSVHADLLARIVQAATHRLVLIAPRPDGGHGFDVRSIQELMAARSLTTGEFHTVVPRLRLLAPNPHWRNTWIFAAGRYFSEPQPHQHQAITELVLSLDYDAPQRLSRICPIGPQLALELVDDGMALALPKWHLRLLQHGLTMLMAPVPPDAPGTARTLIRAADADPEARKLITEQFRDALSAGPVDRATTTAIQGLLPAAIDAVQAHPTLRSLADVKGLPGRSAPSVPDGWPSFAEAITEYPSQASTKELLSRAQTAIEELRTTGTLLEPVMTDLHAALEDRESAEILEEALTHVSAQEPTLVRRLRDEVLPTVLRKPPEAPVGPLDQ